MTQETRVKASFPSVEWFDALREIVNAERMATSRSF